MIVVNPKNIWLAAQKVIIHTADDITGNFDIGFDECIPEETRAELRSFMNWVEDNYHLPVTLWVDFEYKHYLIRRNGKRAGYLFYWSDFSTYPNFENIQDIPQIRLPVRMEHSTMEEILSSFIEAICCYFAWICNTISVGYMPDESDVEEILQAYLKFRT